MNQSEKKYAAKKIKRLAQDKEDEIWNAYNAKVEAKKEACTIKMNAIQEDRDLATKRALKIVKPVYPSMTEIKKAMVEATCSPSARTVTVTLKNHIDLRHEYENQINIVTNERTKAYKAATSVDREPYNKRDAAVHEYAENVIDSIMLGDAKKAIKLIAEFKKKEF
jgi:hypothetical protein